MPQLTLNSEGALLIDGALHMGTEQRLFNAAAKITQEHEKPYSHSETHVRDLAGAISRKRIELSRWLEDLGYSGIVEVRVRSGSVSAMVRGHELLVMGASAHTVFYDGKRIHNINTLKRKLGI